MRTVIELEKILSDPSFWNGLNVRYGPEFLARAATSGAAFVAISFGVGGPFLISQAMSYGPVSTLGWIINPADGLDGTWYGNEWLFPNQIKPGDIITIQKDYSNYKAKLFESEPPLPLLISCNGEQVLKVNPNQG